MELPTSLKQRIILLEQETSGLLTEVWNLDLNLKTRLVEVQQAIARQYLAQ